MKEREDSKVTPNTSNKTITTYDLKTTAVGEIFNSGELSEILKERKNI